MKELGVVVYFPGSSALGDESTKVSSSAARGRLDRSKVLRKD